ncbi:MAG TPA: Ig-like domain-containing protein [Verrucomicrobiae bacterium]
MKNLIPFISLCAVSSATLIAQSTDTAAPRPFIWQAAVKPDAPPATQQAVQVTFTEVASTGPSIPHYYSAQLQIPPLPFNPFPELQLFDIGDNKFMYDDQMVDYFSLSMGSVLATDETVAMSSTMSMAPPCNPCSTNGNGSEGSSFSGAPYNIAANDLWVKITRTNSSTGFLLDVSNTVSGVTYGVGLKSSMNPDPFNTWILASVFQATSTSKQLLGNASAATRFYNAVNLDTYVGPSVSIVSPASGITVSNDVPLQIRVTDILPLWTVKVYVDAVQVGVISPGLNGTFTVPTYLFPNGQHQIWVQAGNQGVPIDTDGDSVVDDVSTFQGGASVTLNFTNDVGMQNYSPLYSKASSITLQYSAVSTQDYTFEILKTNGTLLHTTNGQFSGSLSRQWNYTDLSGNAVTNGVYVFSLTYSTHTGGSAAAAAGKKIITTNFVDNGVTVGKYVISYGTWPSSSLNNGLADMNAYVSVKVNAAAYFNEDIIGSGRDDYNTVHADFSSDPFPIRLASQTNDLSALTNALKDVFTGSWLFDGHSSINNLIHDGASNPYLTIDLSARMVAALLGNPYNSFIMSTNGGPLTYNLNYGRRLFSTIITGCNAAMSTSEWPDVTGTPPGVDQASNSQIKKTAFVGFAQGSYTGSTKMNWINRLHYEWIDGEDYDTEISTAVWRANLAYTTVQSWGPTVYGFGFLGYNGNESR